MELALEVWNDGRPDLEALALRLRATALQPGPLSGQATLRIAASYHWLARQLKSESLVSP